MKTLTAVLFVGGESRRMGVDKATLILRGEPLWSRQLRVLRELSPETILISARKKPKWCPPDVGTVLDEPPSRGPLSGLAAALKQVQTTHLIALAIDLPEITSVQLKKLWSLARQGIGVIPRNGKILQPLSAIYPLESRIAVEESLASQNVSLHGLIRTLTVRRQIEFFAITKLERTAYRNVNAPEQWWPD